VLATEIWLLAFNYPYNDRRRRQRHLYRQVWRVRTMWAGLAPVFMKATMQAIVNGPNRKPSYKVTRKHNDVRWHWQHTLPQTTIVLTIAVLLFYTLRFNTLPNPTLLIGSVYWGGLNIVLLSNFVTRSWHGLTTPMSLLKRRIDQTATTAVTPAEPARAGGR
jgi:cellulose synthase (UDP-forming)